MFYEDDIFDPFTSEEDWGNEPTEDEEEATESEEETGDEEEDEEKDEEVDYTEE